MSHQHAPHGHFNASIIVTLAHLNAADPVAGFAAHEGTGDGLYLDLAIYLARVEVVQHGTYEVIEVTNVYELPPNQGGGWRVELHVQPITIEDAADRAMGAVTASLTDDIYQLTKTIEYMANTTHQTHHKEGDDYEVGWRQCSKPTCKEAVRVLADREPF